MDTGLYNFAAMLTCLRNSEELLVRDYEFFAALEPESLAVSRHHDMLTFRRAR